MTNRRQPEPLGLGPSNQLRRAASALQGRGQRACSAGRHGPRRWRRGVLERLQEGP